MILNACPPSRFSSQITYKTLQHFRKYLAARKCSTQISKSPNDKQIHVQFIKIYELPFIGIGRLISRFKLYHTVLTAFVLPSSVFMHSTGFIAEIPIIEPAIIGLGGCAIFYSSGYILNNLIGAVYISKSADTVKLSYIDFWGRRINTECSISDIVPLSDEPFEKNFLKMSKIQRHSSSQKLKIATESGRILKSHAFDEIFFRTSNNSHKQN